MNIDEWELRLAELLEDDDEDEQHGALDVTERVMDPIHEERRTRRDPLR